MATYQTRNPLARTSPLRSMAMFRTVESVFGPSKRFAAETMLASAERYVAAGEQNLRDAYAYLGTCNRVHRLRRRMMQSNAMRLINDLRRRLKALRADVVAAAARVAALLPEDNYVTPWLATQAAVVLTALCRPEHCAGQNRLDPQQHVDRR